MTSKKTIKPKIALITDSSCDLDPEVLVKYGIYLLSLKVVYPGQEYQDVDIEPGVVYARMPGEVPFTSMPSAGEVIALLEKLKAEGFQEVLGVFISSGLSGTAEMFKMVSEQVEGIKVRSYDSLTLSMGLGYLVIEAAEQIKQNVKLDEIMEGLSKIRERIEVLYVIPTLQYLRKGGRIGLVEGTIAEFLNIKPIISVNPEGKYFTMAKARGRKASLQKLFELVRDKVEDQKVDLSVVHGDALKDAEDLKQKLKSSLPNIRNINTSQIRSSALGVHTGPGLVGVIYHLYEKVETLFFEEAF